MEQYIKENIERLIYAYGYTQVELAYKANLSRQTMNKLLASNSKYKPKLSTLIAISNALSINFPELLVRTNKITKSEDFSLKSSDFYQAVFVKNLRLYLRQWKQYSLSSNDGIGASTITNILKGKYNDIYFSTIEAIARAMDVPLASLFEEGKDGEN